MDKLYDVRCFELAEYFLDSEDPPATVAEKAELSTQIQDVVDDWFSERSAKRANNEL